MKIWLVACSKGGVGKTTLAVNLAAAEAAAGDQVTLVDADPQGSTTRWSERRAALGSVIPVLDGHNRTQVRRLPAGAGTAIVDTPAGVGERELEPFLDVANAVLVPMQPSAFDIEASARFLDALAVHPRVRRGALPVALVVNRSKPQTQASQQAVEMLRGWNFPVVAQLRDSQAYTVLTGLGRSLFDYHSAQVRSHQDDWQPLFQWLRKQG